MISFGISWSLMKKASYFHKVTGVEEEAQRRGFIAFSAKVYQIPEIKAAVLQIIEVN